MKVAQEIKEVVCQLDEEHQEKLLAYAKEILNNETQKQVLLRFAGSFPKDDLLLMSKAIEDANFIDEHGW